MKRIRYLSLLLVLLCSIIARAQTGGDDTDFNPTSPAEPGQMETKLKVSANPSDGGSVSGGGSYKPGTSVTVYAYVNSGYQFVNWTDENGNEVSTNETYQFAKSDKNEKLTANFKFVPNSPGEPVQLFARYRLTVITEEGGSVSGAGVYAEGASVTLRASVNSGFDFVGWYDGETCMSTDKTYKFAMVGSPLTLKAKFKFNPDAPAEPSQLFNTYAISLLAEEGGSVSMSPTSQNNRYKTGTSLTLYAYTNSGYAFTGWYKDGEFYSSESNATYTVEEADVEMKAHFKYVPDSPEEPESAGQRSYSFNIYNINCKPGDTVEFPLYLTWTETLKDMSFQLTFHEKLSPDVANVALSEKAVTAGYTLSSEAGTALEGNKGYVFTLSGGKLEGEGNTVLLNFTIPVPADMQTGVYYPVTINQIQMTKGDGTVQKAGSHNGRVSVYKKGDTNGDNEVDSSDILNMTKKMLNKETEIFILEVSDVNTDEIIDSSDILGVTKLVLQIE